MTEQGRLIRMPLYFKEFQCIGGSCEDNCCVGWDVEIDKKTYHHYRKVKDAELSRLFRNHIFENTEANDDHVDYAIVKLAKNNRCPFLNEEGLCKIQSKLGHDTLSNVCATYPRNSNQVDGVIEFSSNLSCPEAARLILKNQEGIQFLQDVQIPSSKMIINYSIDTQQHRGNRMVKYFLELRDFTISVLQNREYLLWERILMLGHFYHRLERALQENKDVPIPELISTFTQQINRDEWREKNSFSPADYPSQLGIMKEITSKMNRLTQIDSERYLRFSEEFNRGLGIDARSDLESEGKAYRIAYERFYQPLMKDHEYLLENYLVNYVFGELFPVLESTKPYEAYMMLVIRYAFIKSNLIGISGFRKGLTVDDCVEFIQVFSKAIEHHHTYLEGIANYMKAKKYFTLPYAELLIH